MASGESYNNCVVPTCNSRALYFMFSGFVFLSIISSATFLSLNFSLIFNALIVVLFFVLIFFVDRPFSFVIDRSVVIFMALFFLVLVLGLFGDAADNSVLISSVMMLLMKMIIFFWGAFFLVKNNFNYLKVSSDIIFFLSIVSSVAFFVVFGAGYEFLPQIQVGYLKTYGYVTGAYGNDVASLVGFLRNSGFFYEPGVFAVFLNFIVLCYLFIFGNLFRAIVSTVVIFTTISFSGIAVALLLWFIYLLRKVSVIGVLTVLGLVVLSCFLVSSLSVVDKIETTSYMLRSSDINTALNLFYQHPFLGWGILNDDKFKIAQYMNFGIDRSSSNGWFSILYQCGIFGSALVFVICSRFVFLFERFSVRVAVLLWLFFSIFSQNIILSNFFVFILIARNIERRFVV